MKAEESSTVQQAQVHLPFRPCSPRLRKRKKTEEGVEEEEEDREKTADFSIRANNETAKVQMSTHAVE